ncbi:hypothetical protein HCA89_00295 [Listeria innocua]|uniref:Uncharacterized protein n=1 Tax=Listeria innocua TaxID=1642 RepID=A0AB73H6E4_LISIO|nr:hypothetical protein [Listeria innocua]MBC2140731.1 hypothetical protein [Listeria innocua]
MREVILLKREEYPKFEFDEIIMLDRYTETDEIAYFHSFVANSDSTYQKPVAILETNNGEYIICELSDFKFKNPIENIEDFILTEQISNLLEKTLFSLKNRYRNGYLEEGTRYINGFECATKMVRDIYNLKKAGDLKNGRD